MNINRQIVCFVSLLFICSCASVKDIRNGEEGTVDIEQTPFALGEGDGLSINVWRHPELSREVRIDPSGNIDMALAGQVKASGLTISKLKEEISSKLARYLVDPRIDINIVKIRSLSVHVLGEVATPGNVILDSHISVLTAITRSGGFTHDANQKHVLLVRNEDGAAKVSVLDLGMKTLKNEGSNQGGSLKDGDIVYVPSNTIADVERFMRRFHTIINPFVTLERAIIFGPEVRDVLSGEENTTDDTTVILAP